MSSAASAQIAESEKLVRSKYTENHFNFPTILVEQVRNGNSGVEMGKSAPAARPDRPVAAGAHP